MPRSRKLTADARCRVLRPSCQSTRFAGAYIHLLTLSERCGVTKGHLTRVLRGDAACSISLLKKICDALSITSDQFFAAVEKRGQEWREEQEKFRESA